MLFVRKHMFKAESIPCCPEEFSISSRSCCFENAAVGPSTPSCSIAARTDKQPLNLASVPSALLFVLWLPRSQHVRQQQERRIDGTLDVPRAVKQKRRDGEQLAVQGRSSITLANSSNTSSQHLRNYSNVCSSLVHTKANALDGSEVRQVHRSSNGYSSHPNIS